MGFLLYIIASLSTWVLQPFMYLFGVVFSLINKEFNSYNMDLAIAKDKYGNVLCQYIFNLLFIKKEGYKFGNHNETISSALGKNKVKNTLSILGKVLDFLLNLLDNNHSIKSIKNN